MPPATEYLWTLSVTFVCPSTVEYMEGAVEEMVVTGSQKVMEDTLTELRTNGLTVQTGETTWTHYPNVLKVEITRDELP